MHTYTRASSGLDSFSVQRTQNQPTNTKQNSLFGEDGFTFGDIIDIINPLQHIPIISSIYRKITGDTIAPAMRVAGGALFGGPIGAAVSLVSTGIQAHITAQNENINAPDTNLDPTTIAEGQNPDSPRKISLDDYQKNNDEKNEISNSLSLHLKTDIKTNRQVYQHAYGIMNAGYADLYQYDHAVSAKPNNKTIDVIIGGRHHPI